MSHIKAEIIKIKNKGIKVCAVLKANAYGLGMMSVAQKITNIVDYFAVARVCEGVKIKQRLQNACVLVLSKVITKAEIKKAIKNNLILSVDSADDIIKIEKIATETNAVASIHIQVDTGMNRFGAKSIREIDEIIGALKSSSSVLLLGVYSHLFCATNNCVAKQQKLVFDNAINYIKLKLKDLNIDTQNIIFHLSSSAKSSDNNFSYDMVRLGISLFESSSSLSGKVLSIKAAKKGETIGYNGAFVCNKDVEFAIVDVGYGDARIRSLSGKGKVIIKNTYASIIGNVCMDCLFVDVTNLNAKVGDRAVIWGNSKKLSISICEVAALCDTISYEMLTSVSNRVQREYKFYANNNRQIQSKEIGVSRR